jgi:recombinational DNA repair protein (RecF pathway)
MQAEPRTQAACAVLAEIATTFAQEGQADPRGFRLLGACLDALEAGVEAWVVVRYFELWTLRLQGLLPEWERCAVCGGALPSERGARVAVGLGICCEPCGRGVPGESRRLDAVERRFLDLAVRRRPTELSEVRAAGLQAGGGLDLLLRGTLEAFTERPLRTYRHLIAATAA